MKRLLIIALGLSLCASVVFGQVGGIGLYSDMHGTDCDVEDVGPALVPVYAVHMYCVGATASQWMLVLGGGFNCIYTGEMVTMPTSIGSTQAGISLGYGGCIPCPTLLVTINFFCQGVSPHCAYLEIVGDIASASGQVEIVDCDFNLQIGSGGRFIVNAEPFGTCAPCGIIASKETNWGKVKALY